MYIDSYSSRGFMVYGNRVLGPCALLPHSVVQWNVSSEEIEGQSPFCPWQTWLFRCPFVEQVRALWGKLRELVLNLPPPNTGRNSPGHH